MGHWIGWLIWPFVFVEGESYKRLVARDGKPLPPKEEAKEEEKGPSEEEAMAGLGALFG